MGFKKRGLMVLIISFTILGCFNTGLTQTPRAFFKEGLTAPALGDSMHIKKKSPRGAMIRTAFIPGWGQWYNEQYVKAILVFGVRSFFIGQAIHFQSRKNSSFDATDRERFGTKRNDAIVYYGIATLISMIDAYIDAHLFDFDTGPDLDMGVGVLPIQTGGGHFSFTLGLSLQARF